MCKVTPLIMALLVSLTPRAQNVFSNSTNSALKTVIEDYPNHFNNIKGDRIQAASTVNYQSKVVIPGSSCILTKYKAVESYSWTCELFTTNDFQKAQTRFSKLFGEIHNTIIKVEGEKPSILNGQYAAPDKRKDQTTIAFNFLPATGIMQKLHVEIRLLQEGGMYRIILQVYEDVPSGTASI